MYVYVPMRICVGHICKVISLKSKVGQAKIFLKICVRGAASEVLFLLEKIVMVSETGYLIMPVRVYINLNDHYRITE